MSKEHKTTKKGYLRFRKDKNGKLRMEHNVVWEEHYGEIPQGMQIHHIDGNKTNNNIENLFRDKDYLSQIVKSLFRKILTSNSPVQNFQQLVDDFEKTNAQLYQITNSRSYKLALKFNSLFSFLRKIKNKLRRSK